MRMGIRDREFSVKNNLITIFIYIKKKKIGKHLDAFCEK